MILIVVFVCVAAAINVAWVILARRDDRELQRELRELYDWQGDRNFDRFWRNPWR